jgi:hypothetical protein
MARIVYRILSRFGTSFFKHFLAKRAKCSAVALVATRKLGQAGAVALVATGKLGPAGAVALVATGKLGLDKRGPSRLVNSAGTGPEGYQ